MPTNILGAIIFGFGASIGAAVGWRIVNALIDLIAR